MNTVSRPTLSRPEVRSRFKTFLRKLFLAWTFSARNSLANHAAATAFAFLFSVPPAALLILMFMGKYLSAFPGVEEVFTSFLATFNIPWRGEFSAAERTAFGFIGILNLIWSSRMFVVSLHRGLCAVFPTEKNQSSIVQNAVYFGVLAVLVFAVVLVMLTITGLGVLADAADAAALPAPLLGALSFASSLFFFLTGFGLIYLSYRYIPPKRPRPGSAAGGTVLFLIAFVAAREGIALFVNPTRYSVMYGLLGSLILSLMFVYIVSILYFLCAEYTYVSDSYDVLVLDRVYQYGQNAGTGKKDAIAQYLFRNPESLFDKYSRRYAAGGVLFSEADRSQDAFILLSGRVDIYLKKGEKDICVASIREGEILGEMAYLLGEQRTATAVASVDSILLVLPPQVFEKLLQVNKYFSRDIIRLLSGRLKRTNQRLLI